MIGSRLRVLGIWNTDVGERLEALGLEAWRQGNAEAIRNLAKVRRTSAHEVSGDKEAKYKVQFVDEISWICY